MIRKALHKTLLGRLNERRKFVQVLVGGQGIGIEEFLLKPAEHWVS